jgi:hypothetical protein
LGEHVVGALIAALVALGVTGAITILRGGDPPIRERLADIRKDFDTAVAHEPDDGHAHIVGPELVPDGWS